MTPPDVWRGKLFRDELLESYRGRSTRASVKPLGYCPQEMATRLASEVDEEPLSKLSKIQKPNEGPAMAREIRRNRFGDAGDVKGLCSGYVHMPVRFAGRHYIIFFPC